ncbi:type II toxin-antitoxin system RelE/ParE family toxin [Methyloprofundus sp.]|uniref:type II toxin-antitoxin system RelE/ParE family toxin n=1 Tax=Methyloprofundus sp. TaxID=2020875 RepID=UPI003D12DC31
MDISNKKILARFYQTINGNEPAREWLLKLDEEDRKTIGKDIQKVEFGWPIGMPYCRPLGNGLYEVRSDISNQLIARVIFFIKANEMILLHGFIKKSQKTLKPDLDLAIKRKKEVEKND